MAEDINFKCTHCDCFDKKTYKCRYWDVGCFDAEEDDEFDPVYNLGGNENEQFYENGRKTEAENADREQ